MAWKKGNWKQGMLFFLATLVLMGILAAIAGWQGWFQSPV